MKKTFLTLLLALGLCLNYSCSHTQNDTSLKSEDNSSQNTVSSLTPSEQEGIYFIDNNCFKSIGKFNENSAENFAKKILSVKETFLSDVKTIHYSLIPDKLYYADTQGIVTNYADLFESVTQKLSDISYIDLRNTLSLSDYHLSDHHWKQENIIKVANTLGEKMGFEVKDDFQKQEFSPYYGTYAPHYTDREVPAESLCYLENDFTQSAVVESFDNPDGAQIYDKEKLTEKTPYNMYLSGPSALVKITTQAESGRKLILFGDSFSSSLAPLLTQVYSEIVIVDLRYMHPSLIGNYVTFDNNCEVLFLYCTNIANSSYMLK